MDRLVRLGFVESSLGPVQSDGSFSSQGFICLLLFLTMNKQTKKIVSFIFFHTQYSTFWALMVGCWFASVYVVYQLMEDMNWLWYENRIFVLGR